MGSIYRKSEPILDPISRWLVLDPITGKPRRKEVGPYWIKFYRHGRPFRESTHTLDKAEAKNLLKQREGEVAKGEFSGLTPERVKYEELAADLRIHYETSGVRDLKEADGRLKPLHAFFGGRLAKSIQPDLVTKYTQRRQADGMANATINRELEVLTKMFRLGFENHKVTRIPIIRQLKEAPPRSGFFERKDFESVRRQLRDDLQVAVSIAYTYGWRMQSEVLPLQLAQIDLEADTLRLAPGTTKNDDGRVVYLTPELKTLITEQVDRVKILSKRLQRIIPHLFPHLMGKRAGQRIKDFRKAWTTACEAVGLTGMLRHDFRRSAVRNLVNAGVSESVAMKITGHRTREVFDRYTIVSPADLQEASQKVFKRIAGTIPGTPQLAIIDPQKLSVR